MFSSLQDLPLLKLANCSGLGPFRATESEVKTSVSKEKDWGGMKWRYEVGRFRVGAGILSFTFSVFLDNGIGVGSVGPRPEEVRVMSILLSKLATVMVIRLLGLLSTASCCC